MPMNPSIHCAATPPAMRPHVLTEDVWGVVLAIAERARATGATPEQRVAALKVGMTQRQAGRSPAVAVSEAVRHLPNQRALRVLQ